MVSYCDTNHYNVYTSIFFTRKIDTELLNKRPRKRCGSGRREAVSLAHKNNVERSRRVKRASTTKAKEEGRNWVGQGDDRWPKADKRKQRVRMFYRPIPITPNKNPAKRTKSRTVDRDKPTMTKSRSSSSARIRLQRTQQHSPRCTDARRSDRVRSRHHPRPGATCSPLR